MSTLIHHSTTPGATGSVPVHFGTGTFVARDEDRTGGTIPMPTFARRPSYISGGYSTEFQSWTAKTLSIGDSFR